MIKEIVATIKTDALDILFRMDSSYFDKEIIKTIESLGCKYLIKGKPYPPLASQIMDKSVLFVKGEEDRPNDRTTHKVKSLGERKKICRVSRIEVRKRKSTIITFRRL